MLVAELGPEGTLASSWFYVQLCPGNVNSLHGSIYKVLSKTQGWTRDCPKKEQSEKEAWQLPISAYWAGPGGSMLLSAGDRSLVPEQ